MFGLSFIIGLACLVTILNLLMLKLFIFLGVFRRALAPRIDRWIQDGVFQLQRRAYESDAQSTWKHLNSEIPITESPDLLYELPLKAHCPTCSVAEGRPRQHMPDTELDVTTSTGAPEGADEMIHSETAPRTPSMDRSQDGGAVKVDLATSPAQPSAMELTLLG